MQSEGFLYFFYFLSKIFFSFVQLWWNCWLLRKLCTRSHTHKYIHMQKGQKQNLIFFFFKSYNLLVFNVILSISCVIGDVWFIAIKNHCIVLTLICANARFQIIIKSFNFYATYNVNLNLTWKNFHPKWLYRVINVMLENKLKRERQRFKWKRMKFKSN